jgi:autotransporter-associated beta strand protein
LNYSGVLSGSAHLQISAGQAGGAGVTTLSNNNSFTGDTYLNTATNHVFRIGVNDALPTGTTVFFGASAGGGTADTGGSIDLNGFNLTIGGLEKATASGRGIGNNTSTLSTLTIGKASGTNTFNGIIGTVANTNMTTQSDNIAVVKTGNSTQVLTAANTYSGGTTVSAGTLLVANITGSATGSGNVLVESGGTLAGSGIIAPANGGSLTFNSGSTVSVGSTGDTAAQQLEFIPASGSITTTFEAGSTLEFDLFTNSGNNTSILAAADRLFLNGDAIFEGNITLRVSTVNPMSFAIGDVWKLLDWSSLNITANTATITEDLPTLTGGLSWDTSAFFTSGTLSVVPEPSRALLTALGLLSLLLRRRQCLTPARRSRQMCLRSPG